MFSGKKKNMQPIMDNTKHDQIPAVFQLGFRIFFLSGTIFCVIALFLWGTLFFHGMNIQPFGGSYWWHSHEMVFGFSSAIIAGFLLTAVQTWTGIPSVKGSKLSVIFIIWLAARLLLLFPGNISSWVVSIIDLAFLPFVAIALGYPVIRVKQWRNIIFLPILLLLFIENFITHRGVWLEQPELSQNGITSAVFTVILLISVMGGRVIPFFTARATGTEQPAAISWLEIVANLPLVLLVLHYLSGKPDFVSSDTIALVSITGAIFQLMRLTRWQFWLCFKVPLLWSLHFSYLFIPLGLLLLGLHHWGYEVTSSHALHSFTVGTIGGLILAMIARVSLGHTGRKLEALPGMSVAFFMMILAGLVRSPLSAFEILPPVVSLGLGFVFFIMAYCIYLWHYFPILVKRRIDGRPG